MISVRTTSMLLRSLASASRSGEVHSNEELIRIQDTTASKRRTVQDEGHTHQWPLLGVVNMHVYLLSCGVLLSARRGLTGKRRGVCQPNFGWQLWKRNGYICVYFYWPPGSNCCVNIYTTSTLMLLLFAGTIFCEFLRFGKNRKIKYPQKFLPTHQAQWCIIYYKQSQTA